MTKREEREEKNDILSRTDREKLKEIIKKRRENHESDTQNIQEEERDEDEIVIAPMNVEGMPWYNKEAKTDRAQEPIGKRETFYAIMGALKAGLLVGGIFAVALILFTLFCTEIWLK